MSNVIADSASTNSANPADFDVVIELKKLNEMFTRLEDCFDKTAVRIRLDVDPVSTDFETAVVEVEHKHTSGVLSERLEYDRDEFYNDDVLFDVVEILSAHDRQDALFTVFGGVYFVDGDTVNCIMCDQDLSIARKPDGIAEDYWTMCALSCCSAICTHSMIHTVRAVGSRCVVNGVPRDDGENRRIDEFEDRQESTGTDPSFRERLRNCIESFKFW